MDNIIQINEIKMEIKEIHEMDVLYSSFMLSAYNKRKVRVKMKPTNLFEEYGPRYDKHRKEVVININQMVNKA